MTVLVTGGCGFVGSWVCEHYARRGERVIAYDNLTKHELMRTGYDVESARHLNTHFLAALGVEVVEADVRDQEALFASASAADFIVHAAAQPAMTISLEQPELDMSTNVLGTLNVLQAARRFAIPLVSCATIHVYGNAINAELTETDTRYVREPAAINEAHPTLGGTLTPLHASKAAAEIYVRAWIDSFAVKAASFRLSGLYGPRQLGGEDHGWVANFAIRAALGLPVNIYGSGKQVRDILFVEDLVGAFDAFRRNPIPGVYNIGGGERTAISLRECLRLIERVTGRAIDTRHGPERAGDLSYFVCDISRIRDTLGWQPTTLPEEGVRALVAWIADNRQVFAP